jgi:hypothetical protein
MMESKSFSCVRPSELFGCNAELQHCHLPKGIGSNACKRCVRVFEMHVRVVRAAFGNRQAAKLAWLFVSHGVATIHTSARV